MKGGDPVKHWSFSLFVLLVLGGVLGACTHYYYPPPPPPPPPPAAYSPPPQGLAPPHGYVGPTDPQRGSR